jgi:sRNA-binding protein
MTTFEPETAAQRRLERLCGDRFPLAFRGPPRPPLAIGIFNQILDTFVGKNVPPSSEKLLQTAITANGNGKNLPPIDRYDLGRFLKWWCSRPDYLDAIAHREPRLNLDGSPAGVPTPEQQRDAARRLWARLFSGRRNPRAGPRRPSGGA